MKSIVNVALLASILAPIASYAAQPTYAWRSSTTGVIKTATATTPPTSPPVTVPPTPPTSPSEPEDGFVLTVAGARTVARSAKIALTPTASKGVAPYTYSYSGSLPPGASFSKSTGKITGTALVSGTYKITLIAIDKAGTAMTIGINLVVT